MITDLHCHSTASDGELSPQDLYAMAQAGGVQMLALTDHDTLEGVRALEAQLARDAGGNGCRFIAGIEISALWRKRGVHILGLNINPAAALWCDALAGQRDIRFQRARRIAAKLERQGLAGAYDGALAEAGDCAPCRPHFAAWLVAQGYCKDGKQAFDRYLGNNKLAAINHDWPAIEQAVAWIVAAGGIAVLAHPEDYRLTRSKLRSLLGDFVAAGGRAVELAAPGKPDTVAQTTELLCREFGLAASVGSDYHGAYQGWRRLGRTRAIPPGMTPVWELFA